MKATQGHRSKDLEQVMPQPQAKDPKNHFKSISSSEKAYKSFIKTSPPPVHTVLSRAILWYLAMLVIIIGNTGYTFVKQVKQQQQQ